MSHRKLLLADDSVTIQKVVNLTFADEGIEVVTVSDGDAAIEKASEFKPDLILADVNMPGLNGYQVCEKIKQTDEFHKIPVILLVGSFEPFDEAEAQRVGADDFLTKPFQSIRQLVSKVTELLDTDGKAANSDVYTEAENSDGGEESATSFENSEAESDSKFGDVGADDEIIQTTPTSGFGLDEVGKFETKESTENSAEPFETQFSEDYTVENFTASPADESQDLDDPLKNDFSSEQNPDETSFAEATIEKSNNERSFSTVDLDFDDDFLELPLSENEATANPAGELSPEMAETSAENIEERPSENSNRFTNTAFELNNDEQNQSNAASFVASSELSSETIDIIVQKVVEKLSDKVVREIAWEVVPQMTELIVKQMAEEKFKES